MITQRKSPNPKKRRELLRAPNYCPPGPVRRIERTYSRRRKQEVLLFLVHHRIPMRTNDTSEYLRLYRILYGMPEVEEKGYRRPTTQKAAQYFRITSCHVNWQPGIAATQQPSYGTPVAIERL
jgi:hypothetical protein